MKKNFENKIRINAILIYLIVIGLSGTMFVYLYNQKENIDAQKKNIEKDYRILDLTHEIIFHVNQAQANANFYITSKKAVYITQFTQNMTDLQLYIDSLKLYLPEQTKTMMLDTIDVLLYKKVSYISQLNIKYNNYNTVDSLNKKLRTLELDLIKDIASNSGKTTTTTSLETLPPKKIMQRVKEVFVPTKEQRAKISIGEDSTYITNKTHLDTLPKVHQLLELTQKTGKKYTRQITDIEQQVSSLMASDYAISVQLSNLLITLHQQTINSTMDDIKKSESLIRQNYIKSIAGVLTSLALILILIILMVRVSRRVSKMQEVLEKANTQIKETMESRHKLFLSVSHDVKTPISSILGYLELWEHGHPVSSKEIKSMQNSSKHILDMVETLLDFSSIEQGMLQMNASNFNLYKLCTLTAELLTPLALQKKLSLETHFDFDEGLYLQTDTLKVKQIMNNLLSNAIKYTVSGKIIFDVTYRENKILLRVNDTGVGIPENRLNSIFEPFSRVEENNKLAKGSGFGLYVVKGLIEFLGGTIQVQSTVGKGTQITVSIPASEVFENKTEIKPKRILSIDDDTEFLVVLQEMLQKLGHTIDVCNTIESFEKHVEHVTDYDVILTDANMDTHSGIDVLNMLKSKGVKLPIILVSGANGLNHAKVKELGFDDYIKKPLSIYVLKQMFGDAKNTKPSQGAYQNQHNSSNGQVVKFIETANQNIAKLKQAVVDDNFEKSRAICKEMLPVFEKLNVSDIMALLKKINDSSTYPAWEEDIIGLVDRVEELVEGIQNKIS